MENFRSLKTIVEKDVASDLKFKKRIDSIPYLIAAIIILAIIFSNSGLIIIPTDLWILISAVSLMLIFILSLFQKYLKKEILKKADMLTVGVIRIEITELLKDYFGADRIDGHKEIIREIFSEITDMALCRLSDNRIITPSLIEFKPLEYIFKQNGEAIILIGFEIDEDGKTKMNYIKNEEVGDFKLHQFPYTVEH